MPPRRIGSVVHTPSKRRVSIFPTEDEDELAESSADEVEATPSKRRKIADVEVRVSTPRRSKAGEANGGTPGRTIPIILHTPSKSTANVNGEAGSEDESETIGSRLRNANRSAKRKSAGRLLERAIVARDSEDEGSEEEDQLAEEIYDDEDQEDAEEQVEQVDADAEGDTLEPETPSKRRKGRPRKSVTGAKAGRGRKAATEREETPPSYLPPHEKYFWDNRTGATKTSNNTFPSGLLLNHEEYFDFKKEYIDPNQQQLDHLQSLHEEIFEQWQLELEYDFNICLYGFGSKRNVIESFADFLHSNNASDKPPKVIIVNGYEPSTTVRHILTTLSTTIKFPSTLKLPSQPQALLQLLTDTLTKKPPKEPTYILINSLDAQALRRSNAQSLLASLAEHPSIHVVATCDTANFPLMWDLKLRRQYNWVFHECTTLAAFDQELDVVETVNALLGRSSRRIGGRDGVGYVLRSLPENARNLYRILVGEQLAFALEHEDGGSGDGDEGIEYRILYHKAREELVCSTEHQFRTLLKEFFDHQMVESRRDALGSERLVVPFRQEELEGLLEDLVDG